MRPAAGAVHQHDVAHLKLPAIDQRVIGRAVGGEEGRVFRIVKHCRQRRKLRRGDDRLVAIGAVAHLDDDPVARLHAFYGAIDFDHITGGFHARRKRQLRLELIFAGRHQDVGEIDPGGANGDAHLPRRQRYRRKAFQPQVLRRSEFAADDRLRHQAARSLARDKASRISGIRSLPKYMSVLSRKMVGDPNPPRAITSSVLALS